LARVSRIAPVPRFSPGKTECDADTLHAVITHRYYVLAQYTRSVRNACRQEISRLERLAGRSEEGIDSSSAAELLRWLRLHTWDRRARRPLTFDPALRKAYLLRTVYSMRQELSALWADPAPVGPPTSCWTSCVTGARAPSPVELQRCASSHAACRT
jgi:stearoyl-CoA desaturase (delta-9 desaturase)